MSRLDARELHLSPQRFHHMVRVIRNELREIYHRKDTLQVEDANRLRTLEYLLRRAEMESIGKLRRVPKQYRFFTTHPPPHHPRFARNRHPSPPSSVQPYGGNVTGYVGYGEVE